MEFRCLAAADAGQEPMLRRGMEEFNRRRGLGGVLECFDRREALLYRMQKGCCDAALVLLPGAIGMECALGIREIDAELPLVWISDVPGFALQSYRLQARMFLRTPVTEQEIAAALERCYEPMWPQAKRLFPVDGQGKQGGDHEL